jgi:hypothetical protein
MSRRVFYFKIMPILLLLAILYFVLQAKPFVRGWLVYSMQDRGAFFSRQTLSHGKTNINSKSSFEKVKLDVTNSEMYLYVPYCPDKIEHIFFSEGQPSIETSEKLAILNDDLYSVGVLWDIDVNKPDFARKGFATRTPEGFDVLIKKVRFRKLVIYEAINNEQEIIDILLLNKLDSLEEIEFKGTIISEQSISKLKELYPSIRVFSR